MKTSAKIFAGGVAAAGAAVLAAAATRWELSDWPLFGLCLAAAIALSAVKIRVPGNTATVTGGFVMLLIGGALLGWQATVAIAALAGVAHTVLFCKKRPAVLQTAFNVGSLVLSALAAAAAPALAFGTPVAQQYLMASLLVSATVLFAVNLLLVATVVSLADQTPVWRTIARCNFSSFPFYGVGAVVAYAALSAAPNREIPLLVTGLVMVSAVACYRELVDLWARARA